MTVAGYCELEITLARSDAESYSVELRFQDPMDDAVRAPVRGFARFDLGELRQLSLQPDHYGIAQE